MNRQEELEKTDRAIKDATIRLHTMRVSYDAIEREVNKLSAIEAQLDANVSYLKRKHVIALAFEYRKAKTDLLKIRQQIILVKNDKEAARKGMEELNTMLLAYKEHYNKLIIEGETNVIQGKFGRQL